MIAGPEQRGWFNPLAEYVGLAYLRNAFTKGTEQEVEFLLDALSLAPPARVLDVGCGPGRHSLALAARGFDVVGVDLSTTFVALASEAARGAGVGARFEVADVRDLAYAREFDAVICLCQGGFGLLGGRDEPAVVGRMAEALRPGGRLALSAFHAPFVLRHLEAGETFDPASGVLHEVATVRNPDGAERGFDLWTTCFRGRRLAELARAAGLAVDAVHGVAPGRYRAVPPHLDAPELLLLARAPGRAATGRNANM